jgi:hypothetical protein
MQVLVRSAEKGYGADCAPVVRLRAAVLRGALEDFSGMIASRFLGLDSASTDEVLAAYARDYLTHLSHVATTSAPVEHR